MHSMDPNAATGPVPTKDPHMPPMHRVGDLLAPKAPQDVAEARLEEGTLTELALKRVNTINRFTTDWVSKRLRLPLPLAAEIVEQLCREALVEQTMMTSQNRSYFRITQRGRDEA